MFFLIWRLGSCREFAFSKYYVGLRSIHITKTITNDKYLVEIKKDAIRDNVPNQDLVLTKSHKVFFGGKMIEAGLLTCLPRVCLIENTREVLYNILLDVHGLVLCNGLLSETLHPQNPVAKIYVYGSTMKIKEKSDYFKFINRESTKDRLTIQ